MTDPQGDVKFVEWIRSGFDLYKANLVVWIVASLLAVVISAATLGILSGPMWAGLTGMALAQLDRKKAKPEIGDVLRGFDVFLQSFLFMLVWGLGIAVTLLLGFIGCMWPILAILFLVALNAALMFALFLIVDRKLEFWPASLASFEKIKPAFFPFLGLSVVAGLIGAIGLIGCGIGVIVTLPITTCILAVAYREVFGTQTPSAHV